jgi:hypothetical protein
VVLSYWSLSVPEPLEWCQALEPPDESVLVEFRLTARRNRGAIVGTIGHGLRLSFRGVHREPKRVLRP